MLEWMLFKLEMFHKSLTELPRPGSEESKEREVPAQLQSMAATFNQRRRCSKLRKALQEFVKLPLLAKVEFDYLDCSSDPTRSMNDIHSTILRDFAAKFKGALSTRVPLSEVSDFEDVAINCAESVVWKNLQSIREDIGLHIMIAKDLLWLLEDASHEVPLFCCCWRKPLEGLGDFFSCKCPETTLLCPGSLWERPAVHMWKEIGRKFDDHQIVGHHARTLQKCRAPLGRTRNDWFTGPGVEARILQGQTARIATSLGKMGLTHDFQRRMLLFWKLHWLREGLVGRERSMDQPSCWHHPREVSANVSTLSTLSTIQR